MQLTTKIRHFLQNDLSVNLYPQKTHVVKLSQGIDFLGLRNLYHSQLSRKRNIKKMQNKIEEYKGD